MSGDDFLDDLRGQWQSGQADISHAARNLDERISAFRRLKRLRLAAGVAFGVLAAAFGFASWHLHEPLFHLGAVVFLVAMLLTLGEFLFLRKVTGEDYLAGFKSTFDKAERHAQAVLVIERAAVGACMLLAICAAFALIYAVTGMSPAWKSLALAVLWGGLSIALWFRQQARTAAAQAQLDQLRSMRAELEAGQCGEAG